MPVGAGSIKRAAKTAVIGNPENLEKAVAQTEADAAQTKKAVKEQASASVEEKAAEEKTTKETSAKKKAPARKNAAKTKKSIEPNKDNEQPKTYGINDELPIYLM